MPSIERCTVCGARTQQGLMIDGRPVCGDHGVVAAEPIDPRLGNSSVESEEGPGAGDE